MATEPALALSRRDVLLSAGALIVSASTGLVPSPAYGQSAGAGAAAAGSVVELIPSPRELDSWIAILPDGSAEAFFGKIDMGQGLEVAIAQIVADELDMSVEHVTVRMGDTATTCNQGGASGSTGVSLGARPLRNAAAEARRILLERASKALEVPADQLSVANGMISARGASGKTVSYAELIGGKHFDAPVEWNKAVGNFMDVKGQAKPKAQSEYRLVGKSLARRDVPGKILGTTDYVTDVRLPGMLHARMIRPAIAGSTIASVNGDSINNARVVREAEFLAVVAEREWDAVEAARTLQVMWNPPASDPFPGTDALHEHIRGATVVKREEALHKGDPDAAFKAAARIVQAEYLWPLQSHASMGPACALAHVRDGEATVWTGSQKPHSTRDGVAKLLGLPPDKVRGIWVMGPGSYGRNDAGDAALDAAYVSKLTGRPIRLQGMRSDGTAWDPKGTACVHRARAGLDAAGKVVAYEFVSKGLSRVDVMFNESDPRCSLAGMTLGLPLDSGVGLGTPSESYAFGAKVLAWEVVPPLLDRCSPLRTSHLRDPLGPEVHFGSEQFIDEIAAAVKADPVEFRLQYISAPRDAAVVKAAAEKAGWVPRKTAAHSKRSLHAGMLQGRGIAYAQRGDTVVAVIAEIEVYPKDGRIWARRFTVAHDCGLIINPQSLKQTIEGNIVHGLSRTLFEEVQFDRNSVKSVDWASYPILEMRDAPETIDIVLINSTDVPPSGAGEPTMRCVPAAVANAFWDATGVRLRRVPLSPPRVKAALAHI
ncbi:MAG TPA: molybdopterin cofactor-binding domain-containing protein [Steroidobacteraceae bacterium]|nr:molybdopterin cofactor-binding domain-containing protein [Steroidobacteraceae bacterium]